MATKTDLNPAFLVHVCCQCVKHTKLFLTSGPLITCLFYLECCFFDAFLNLTSIHPHVFNFASLDKLISCLQYNLNSILLLFFLKVLLTFVSKYLSQFTCITVCLLPHPLDCKLHKVPETVLIFKKILLKYS